jgi:hypothetical protein
MTNGYNTPIGVPIGLPSILSLGLPPLINPFPTLNLDFINNPQFDSRITFSRGSQATLFDSTGTLRYAKHNLLLQSQTFQTSWTTSTATVSADAGNAPDGTATADKVIPDNAATGRVQQTFTTTTGVTYTFSCFVKADGFGWVGLGMSAPGAYFDLSGAGAVGTTPAGYTASITSVGSGWYRCVVTLTESGGAARTWRINPASADNTLAVGDGTSGILVWGAQLNIANMEGGVTSSLTTYYPTTTAAYYAPRFDYNPSTLQPLGLLIEEQRTNSIRNNTGVGAVAGTPGTLPTNWTVALAAGLTTNVVGTGISNGVTYVDLQIVGTSNSTAYILAFEGNTQIAALQNQNWTESLWISRIAGSFTDISATSFNIRESNSGGTQVAANVVALSQPTTTLTRASGTATLSQATTAFVTPGLRLTITNGAAIDITLRIGLPQLELGAFATSVIPTTTTALTRNADVASMTGTNFSSWYNQSEGTVFGEYQTVSAGTTQFLAAITSVSETDRITLGQTTTTYVGAVVDTGSTQASITQGTTSLNVAKISLAYAVNNFAFSANGAAPNTDTSGTVPSGVTEMKLGRRGTSTSPLNGWISRIAYYPTRLPNATLVALTA